MTNLLEKGEIIGGLESSYDASPSSNAFLNKALSSSSFPKRPTHLGSHSDLLLEQDGSSSAAAFYLSSSPSFSFKGHGNLTFLSRITDENVNDNCSISEALGASPGQAINQQNIGEESARGSKNTPVVLRKSALIPNEGSEFCTPESHARPSLISHKLIKRNHYRTYHTEPPKGQQPVISDLLFKDLSSDYPTPQRRLWWGEISGQVDKRSPAINQPENDPPKANMGFKIKRRNTINHPLPCECDNNPLQRRRSPRLMEKEERQKNLSESPSGQNGLESFTDSKDKDIKKFSSNFFPIATRLRSSSRADVEKIAAELKGSEFHTVKQDPKQNKKQKKNRPIYQRKRVVQSK